MLEGRPSPCTKKKELAAFSIFLVFIGKRAGQTCLISLVLNDVAAAGLAGTLATGSIDALRPYLSLGLGTLQVDFLPAANPKTVPGTDISVPDASGLLNSRTDGPEELSEADKVPMASISGADNSSLLTPSLPEFSKARCLQPFAGGDANYYSQKQPFAEWDNCEKKCVTAYGHLDGFGAQMAHVFFGIAWATVTRREFVHTPIRTMAHSEDYAAADCGLPNCGTCASTGIWRDHCATGRIPGSTTSCQPCIERSLVATQEWAGLSAVTNDAKEKCVNAPLSNNFEYVALLLGGKAASVFRRSFARSAKHWRTLLS